MRTADISARKARRGLSDCIDQKIIKRART
jgi:hypothetical protein